MNSLVDVAIVTAIEIERKAVCEAFQLTDRDRVSRESRVYWHKTLELKDGEFYEIVVAQSPDMAGVDAALLVSDIIHHWHPGAILLVGIAAGVDRDQQAFGDLVIGRDVYYYERGKLTPDGKRPEPIMYRADATLLNHVQAVPEWMPPAKLIRPDGSQTRPQIHYGVIASGEKVIADSVIRDEITAGHRKIKAIEMEGYGFSAGVWQSFERVRHLVIKAICDFADERKGDDWQRYAAVVAAEFTKHFLLDRPLDPRNPPVPMPWEGVDPRYKPIVEALFDGTVVPFLGSGVNLCDRQPILDGSLNGHPPSEIELAAGLIQEIRKINQIGQSGIMELIGVPCLFCHLDLKDRPNECPIRRKIMAGEAGDQSNEIWKCPLAIEQSLAVAKTNLRFLSQHYKTEKNPKSLYDFVQESFKSSQPNRLHRFLADLPHKMASLPYQLIVTTNYDNLLESAFLASGQPFDVLFYVAGDADAGGGIFKHRRYGEVEAKPIRRANKYSELLPLDSAGTAFKHPVILKLYGSLDDRSFVITEDHHIDYLLNSELEKKIPPKILKILKDSSILFLGYSLNDYDLQLILHQSWVKNLFDTKSSWFIHKSRPGSLEAKLWEKRGVTLIDSTIEEGLTQLESGIDFRLREAGKYD